MEKNYQVLACHIYAVGKTPPCTLYVDCWIVITDSLLLRVQQKLEKEDIVN
jgi:hypothetical protein